MTFSANFKVSISQSVYIPHLITEGTSMPLLHILPINKQAAPSLPNKPMKMSRWARRSLSQPDLEEGVVSLTPFC